MHLERSKHLSLIGLHRHIMRRAHAVPLIPPCWTQRVNAFSRNCVLKRRGSRIRISVKIQDHFCFFGCGFFVASAMTKVPFAVCSPLTSWLTKELTLWHDKPPVFLRKMVARWVLTRGDVLQKNPSAFSAGRCLTVQMLCFTIYLGNQQWQKPHPHC